MKQIPRYLHAFASLPCWRRGVIYTHVGRKLMSLLVLFLCFPMLAGPLLHFDSTGHDFGRIVGPVTHNFEVVNTAADSVSVLGAMTSCNCTTVAYPHEPIAPGDTALVTVTYDPVGRPQGDFTRVITLITTDTITPRPTLTITGKQ
ncbi:MAG: DUF1573 domain-containing protein [Bacteroidales bacterium]|nr:DUF1573 domain-containing protein [Candidatus Sodaliphilus aphodohippi]